ncbi:MAG: PTS IIA-like nitrogen regulatory protein PtsN [Lonepinella koalarum]|nr:PTS IIA-like nitrogen regulatory protein PtsN [Lonepinella koalarum]
MKFTSLLSPDNIRQGVICSSKKNLLEIVGRIAAKQCNITEFNEIDCFENLFYREKLGCTALGNGIALPRARLPKGTSPVAVFLQLATAIDYDAADHRHVDLIFALLIPEDQCANYKDILESLSEKLTDKTLCKQLRNAQSAVELWQVFEYADQHNEEEEKD